VSIIAIHETIILTPHTLSTPQPVSERVRAAADSDSNEHHPTPLYRSSDSGADYKMSLFYLHTYYYYYYYYYLIRRSSKELSLNNTYNTMLKLLQIATNNRQ